MRFTAGIFCSAEPSQIEGKKITPASNFIDWTPENIERLRLMWERGDSVAAIAAACGNPRARNAAIGKAHRLKIAKTGRPVTLGGVAS